MWFLITLWAFFPSVDKIWNPINEASQCWTYCSFLFFHLLRFYPYDSEFTAPRQQNIGCSILTHTASAATLKWLAKATQHIMDPSRSKYVVSSFHALPWKCLSSPLMYQLITPDKIMSMQNDLIKPCLIIHSQGTVNGRLHKRTSIYNHKFLN